MTMTLKEMNLRVFRGNRLPHVFFQPRFEPWYAWHTQFDSLPQQLRNLSLRDVYDLIGASMRSVHYPCEELQACVEKLVELFHPRLVLGISDELPEGGGEESFERMKWIDRPMVPQPGRRTVNI